MKSTGKFKLLFIVIVTLVAMLLGWAIYMNIQKSATIIIDTAPSKVSITLNGKRTKSPAKVKPGSYTINVKKGGFTSFKEKVDIKKGESITVTAILEPNSSETIDWYKDNPSDYERREQLLGQQYEEKSKEIKDNFPIMEILPYIAPRGGFSIDYGVGSDPSSQAVYISYYTDVGKKLAQDFIKDQGYNIDNYEVIYQQKDYDAEPLNQSPRDH